ncbi:hypothetical protein MHYP_G00031350 [Metynnis hypsauchen]
MNAWFPTLGLHANASADCCIPVAFLRLVLHPFAFMRFQPFENVTSSPRSKWQATDAHPLTPSWSPIRGKFC